MVVGVPDTILAKAEALARVLGGFPRVVVAFSAGVDSTFLLAAAARALPGRVLAVTADSPSLPRSTLAEAEAFCRAHGLPHRVVATAEFDNPAYLANDGNRCYHCKASLMEVITHLPDEGVPLLGVIADDLGDHRPGMRAAQERGARFPLAEVGLTKDEIRTLSRDWGLPTWNRPAEPCLSSRVPYGEPVTVDGLRMIEQAEAALHFHGFATCRARHHRIGDGTRYLCRLEVPVEDLPRIVELRTLLVPALTRLGYVNVTLDLNGFHSGGFNELLR